MTSNNKVLCFFNTCAFGDTFFSSSFIKNICDNNKDKNFYYFITSGFSLFNDTSNIKFLGDYTNKYYDNYRGGTCPTPYYDNDPYLKSIFLQNTWNITFEFTYKNLKVVAFNIWCVPLKCGDIEAAVLKNNFHKYISEVNERHNLGLNISFEHINLMPKIPLIPDACMNKFLMWHEFNKNKKSIFIFNYVARSFPSMPHEELNTHIKNIALKYPNINFIVSMHNQIFDNVENIKCCDKDFDCNFTPDGFNLLIIEKINKYCDVILTIVSGSSWIFFNSDIDKQTNKKYIIDTGLGLANSYSERLNSWYKYATNNNKNVFGIVSLDQEEGLKFMDGYSLKNENGGN